MEVCLEEVCPAEICLEEGCPVRIRKQGVVGAGG